MEVLIMFNSMVPFSRNLNNLDSLVGRLFDDTFNLPSTLSTDMKVDIKDNETEYLIEAEVPGVNKEQIKVDYQNNYLTIGIESKNEINEEKENYIRKERASRRMNRSFYIEDINYENIQASYEDGVLKIQLPKDKKAPTKKVIEIQ